MFSLKMVTFCKATNCPSSQELLAFQNSEVEFYAHYPPSEEIVARVEIPLPLYELAEALLGNRHKDFLTLNKLLCDNEGVKV